MRSNYAEKLLTMVSNSHLWHFYTKSYAAHDALNKFYTGLEDIADKYIECDIGAYGPIKPSGNTFFYSGLDSAVSSIKSLKADTLALRGIQDKSGQPGLVSILDELLTLIDQTLYRLTQLS